MKKITKAFLKDHGFVASDSRTDAYELEDDEMVLYGVGKDKYQVQLYDETILPALITTKEELTQALKLNKYIQVVRNIIDCEFNFSGGITPNTSS